MPSEPRHLDATAQPPYIIAGGAVGVDRLKTLAEATWPRSLRWLEVHGFGAGVSVLDCGCGGGEITFRIAAAAGPDTRIVGLDTDAEAIRLARADSRATCYPNCRFLYQDAVQAQDLGQFDIVYLRFLLSHLREPGAVVAQATHWLKPGGRLIVEDVDFAGHFSHPPTPAFDRYVDLYVALARARGADPMLGPKLPALLDRSGYRSIDLAVELPAFMAGPGKRMAELTWQAIRLSAIEAGLIAEEDAAELDRGLAGLTAHRLSIVSLPRIVQVAGRLT